MTEFCSNPVLFLRPDLSKMVFLLAPSGKERLRLKRLVESGGGVLRDQSHMDLKDHAIRLVFPNEWQLKQKNGPDLFSHTYIEHCVAKDEILPNLRDYRANNISKYRDYDPLDILLGQKAWSDLEVIGERVSGDEFDLVDIAFENEQNYKTFKSSRRPYSSRESKEIYMNLKEKNLFNYASGNKIWADLETNGICSGNRTWQSMRNHYLKIIFPSIDQYHKKYGSRELEVNREEDEIQNSTSDESASTTSKSPVKNPRPADDERLSTKEREDINEKRHANASDFARVQAGFAPSHAGTAAVVEASTSADIAEIPVAAPDRSPEQGRSKPTNPEPVSEAEGEILRDAPRQMKRKVMMDTGEDAELNQLMDDTRIVRDSDDEVFQARDEKKKRRLFSNNRSYLDFEVERSESFIVPSPLNYVSRRLRPASVPEAPEEPASEEDFAAGLQSAEGSVTGSSQSSQPGIGSLTSTQRILDTPESVVGTAGVAFAVPGSSNPEELQLALQQPDNSALLSIQTMNELNGLEHPVQSEEEPDSPNLLDEIYGSEPPDVRPQSGEAAPSKVSIRLKSVDEGSLADLQEYCSQISEDESARSNIMTDDLSSDGEASKGYLADSNPKQLDTGAETLPEPRTRNEDVTNSADLNEEQSRCVPDKVQDEERQYSSSDNVAKDLPNFQTQTLSQPHVDFIPVIRSPELPGASTQFENDGNNSNDKESSKTENINKDPKSISGKNTTNTYMPNGYGDDIETMEKIRSFIRDEFHMSSGDDGQDDETGGNLDGILSCSSLGSVGTRRRLPTASPIIAQDEEIIETSDNEDLINGSDKRDTQRTHKVRKKKKAENKGSKKKLDDGRMNIIVHGLPSDVDSSDIDVVRLNRTKIGNLSIPRKMNRSMVAAQQTQLQSPETASCRRRVSTANGQVTPRRISGNFSSSQDEEEESSRRLRRRRRLSTSDSQDGSDQQQQPDGPREPRIQTRATRNLTPGGTENRRNQSKEVAGESSVGSINEEEAVAGPSGIRPNPRGRPRPRSGGRSRSSTPVSSELDHSAHLKSRSAKKRTKLRIIACMDKENGDVQKAESRDPYSLSEDRCLVDYLMANGGYSKKSGNWIWKRIERSNILPGRTWQSLKNRFHKYILRKIESNKFAVTVEDLKKADAEIYGEENMDKERTRSCLYSTAEDWKILDFICENKRFADTGGNSLWKQMEEANLLENRTWQSMKERFRKVLLKNIDSYELSEDNLRRFKAGGEPRVLQRRHRE